MDDFTFDATSVEPAQDSGDPVPAGWYATRTTATTLKPTKAGTGKVLEVEHTITEGDYRGRKVWSRFNVVNPSETAEKIGREQLSALCHATGVLRFKAHEQLRERPVLVRVVVTQDPGYAAKNEVKAWKELAAPAPRPAPVAPSRPVAAAAGRRGSESESFPSALKDEDDDLPF